MASITIVSSQTMILMMAMVAVTLTMQGLVKIGGQFGGLYLEADRADGDDGSDANSGVDDDDGADLS